MTSKFHLSDLVLAFKSYPSYLYVASFLVAVTAIAVVSNAKRPVDNSSIPLYIPETTAAGNKKKRWLFDNPGALQEAYKKFPNNPFRIWTTEGSQLALPARYLDELKMLPDTKFPSALRSFFLGTYLWPIEQWKLDYVHVVLKNDLNKHLPTHFPDILEEVDIVIPAEFPDCRDWTPVKVYPRVLRLVSKINTKILVGNGLHQNEEWIKISASYTKNIFLSSAKLRFFHPYLRPLVQYFIPELRTIWHCNRRARDLLAPVLARRQEFEKKPDFKKPIDSIEWLRDTVEGPDKNDAHLHGVLQLAIAALSVNTTSQLITNAIFNLATWPEYVPILQDEIHSVIQENGGKWTERSMGQLQKMDSFMKETLRHSGHLTITFQRLARQPLTLSDGTEIPAGTMAFSPAQAINFDPEIYPNAETFDGLRFYNLRQASAENEKKFQLTSITKEQMQFGIGRHACPGRWLASHQIKLVLAGLIEKYEFKLKTGEGRPKTILFQTNQLPDPNAEILFKNRK